MTLINCEPGIDLKQKILALLKINMKKSWWLTPKQVGEKLSLCLRTVKKYAWQWRTKRVGKRGDLLIDYRSVLEWLDKNIE